VGVRVAMPRGYPYAPSAPQVTPVTRPACRGAVRSLRPRPAVSPRSLGHRGGQINGGFERGAGLGPDRGSPSRTGCGQVNGAWTGEAWPASERGFPAVRGAARSTAPGRGSLAGVRTRLPQPYGVRLDQRRLDERAWPASERGSPAVRGAARSTAPGRGGGAGVRSRLPSRTGCGQVNSAWTMEGGSGPNAPGTTVSNAVRSTAPGRGRGPPSGRDRPAVSGADRTEEHTVSASGDRLTAESGWTVCW
jgi:hypothetical protein